MDEYKLSINERRLMDVIGIPAYMVIALAAWIIADNNIPLGLFYIFIGLSIYTIIFVQLRKHYLLKQKNIFAFSLGIILFYFLMALTIYSVNL